jgi:ABC-type Zn2+ transport system substrate-binding protein/surface adhesin
MPAVLFRILAVTLLSLTIPLQGMASVVAGHCMAFEHHDDAASHDHEHANGDGDGHEHAADAHSDDGKSSHCGPCTACCASASIAGPAGLSIQPSPSSTKYHFSQLPPPGAEPHRFDRPPLAL